MDQVKEFIKKYGVWIFLSFMVFLFINTTVFAKTAYLSSLRCVQLPYTSTEQAFNSVHQHKDTLKNRKDKKVILSTKKLTKKMGRWSYYTTMKKSGLFELEQVFYWYNAVQMGCMGYIPISPEMKKELNKGKGNI